MTTDTERTAELEREIAALREALQEMVYETTHLSPCEDDGAHWCKISGPTLESARNALGGQPS